MKSASNDHRWNRTTAVDTRPTHIPRPPSAQGPRPGRRSNRTNELAEHGTARPAKTATGANVGARSCCERPVSRPPRPTTFRSPRRMPGLRSRPVTSPPRIRVSLERIAQRTRRPQRASSGVIPRCGSRESPRRRELRARALQSGHCSGPLKRVPCSCGRPAKFRGPSAKPSRLAGLPVKKCNRAGMASP